jgi:hypothetical protein
MLMNLSCAGHVLMVKLDESLTIDICLRRNFSHGSLLCPNFGLYFHAWISYRGDK